MGAVVFVGVLDESLSSKGFREVKQCQQQQLAVGAVWREVRRCADGEGSVLDGLAEGMWRCEEGGATLSMRLCGQLLRAGDGS